MIWKVYSNQNDSICWEKKRTMGLGSGLVFLVLVGYFFVCIFYKAKGQRSRQAMQVCSNATPSSCLPKWRVAWGHWWNTQGFHLAAQNALEITRSGGKVWCRRRHTTDSTTLKKQPKVMVPSVPTPVIQQDHLTPSQTAWDGVHRYFKSISSSFTDIYKITPNPHLQSTFKSLTIWAQSGAEFLLLLNDYFIFPFCMMTWFILFAQWDRRLSTEDSILNINTGWHFKSYLKCHQS